ncbi:MAG: OsmC family peroxiredoxin [Solirubrobacterales bacterium]
MAARIGSAKWQGTLKEGVGRVTIGENGFTGPYSFSSRFEEEDGGTNPEELIAAANAACFTMALNNELFQHDHAPVSVETTAKASIRQIDGLPTIASIELDCEAVVPDIDEAHFIEHAENAAANCIISRALAGVPEITVTAKLVS